jgi:Raf kinase inhibitor-like YbhB/YbcL family protein
MSLDRAIVPDPYDFLPPRPTFSLTSSSLVDGGRMPMTQVHGSAGGDNISPQLSWSGFPAQTRGFTITCFDPDAPTACGFWHWVAVNLPADATTLALGAGGSDATMPGGFQIANDFGDLRGATTPIGTCSWCTRWTRTRSARARRHAPCTSASTWPSTRWRAPGSW